MHEMSIQRIDGAAPPRQQAAAMRAQPFAAAAVACWPSKPPTHPTHLQLPAADVLSVELHDGPLGVLVHRVLHEPEALVLGGALWLHQEALLNRPHVRKHLLQPLVVNAEADAPHEHRAGVLLHVAAAAAAGWRHPGAPPAHGTTREWGGFVC